MRVTRLVLPVLTVMALLVFFYKGLSLKKGYAIHLETIPVEITPQPLNEAQATQYQILVQKLRCVTCYNQNLSESQAPMAMDIKQLLREKIASGISESDIISFMTARYGEFIIYDPPCHSGTLLLWVGPILLLTMAIWVLQKQFSSGKAL